MEDWQTEKSIIESNSFLINNETLSDISFSFPEENKNAEIIYSHKFMLSKRSPVFCAMFNERFEKPTQVVIEDASKESFLMFLHYMYTDTAQITPENVADLFYLGNKYLVKGLQNQCIIYVENNISLDNVLCIANKSIKFVCESILSLCSTFIEEQIGMLVEMETFWNIEELDLIKYILNMDKSSCEEINLFRGVLKWAQKYCDKNEMEIKELTEIFQLIRFPTMSVTEFAECANYREIFSSMAEIGEIFCYITKKGSDADKCDKLPFNKIKREMCLVNVSLGIENTYNHNCHYESQQQAMMYILVLEDCYLTGVKYVTNHNVNDLNIFKGNELIADIKQNHFQREYFLKEQTKYTFKQTKLLHSEYIVKQGICGTFNGRKIFQVLSRSTSFIEALDLKVRR